MISFLYNWFGWVPIAGTIFKGMYITKLVGQIKAKANGWTPGDGIQADRDDLDEIIASDANDFVDELIEEMDIGLLGTLVKKAVIDSVVSIFRRAIIG